MILTPYSDPCDLSKRPIKRGRRGGPLCQCSFTCIQGISCKATSPLLDIGTASDFPCYVFASVLSRRTVLGAFDLLLLSERFSPRAHRLNLPQVIQKLSPLYSILSPPTPLQPIHTSHTFICNYRKTFHYPPPIRYKSIIQQIFLIDRNGCCSTLITRRIHVLDTVFGLSGRCSS